MAELVPCAVPDCEQWASLDIDGVRLIGHDHEGRPVWGRRATCAIGHWYVIPDVDPLANPSDAAL